jgi:3-methyladenine DNA glycosylase/8-oxoguanine DNA glycosylase
MSERDALVRQQLKDDAEAIKMLVDRWYAAEIEVRSVIEKLGTDEALRSAHAARDKAVGALMRSVGGLMA